MTTIQTIQNEVIPDQNEKVLKVLITGTEQDTGLSDELLSQGYQITYMTAQNLPKEDMQFNYKYLQQEIKHAKEHGFDLLLALDEATNKIGMAVRKSEDQNFVVLSQHQLSALFTHLWSREQDEPFTFSKSVFISDLVDIIATKNGQKCKNFLQENFVGDLQNDKEEPGQIVFTETQGIYHSTKSFNEIIHEFLAWQQNLINEGRTLYDELIDLYIQYGFYKQKKFFVDYVSDDQKTHILGTLSRIRRNPVSVINWLSIKWIIDYKKGKAKNQLSGKVLTLDEEKSDVLKLEMTNGDSLIFVPSANKMTYYISVREDLRTIDGFEDENKKLNDRIVKMMEVVNQLI